MSRGRPTQDVRDTVGEMTLDVAEALLTQEHQRTGRELEAIKEIRRRQQEIADHDREAKSKAAMLHDVNNTIATRERDLADVEGRLAEAKATERRETERRLGESAALDEENKAKREQRDALTAELAELRRRFA